MGVLSILIFSHERFDRLRSATSHQIGNSIGYKFILFRWFISGIKETLQIKNLQNSKKFYTLRQQYFGLFLSGASGPKLLFLPDIDLVKIHLLTLNCQDKKTRGLNQHGPQCALPYQVTIDPTPQSYTISTEITKIDFRFVFSLKN